MEAGEALDQTVRLTDLALPPGFVVDLVVWPETPIPEALLDLPRFEDFTQNLLPERAGALLYGTIRREGRVPYNSAVLALPGDEVAAVYDKTHLVVMGEYVPLGDVLPVLRRWVPLGTDFAPGEAPKVFELPSGWRLAPLICFEDVMARVVRRVAPLRPDVLVNITNDGWFNDSPQSLQHFQMARMRCIELRRPMIRASNNGVTGWIDERGVIRELLADPATGRVDISGTVRVRVAIPEGRETLYARWGDWPGWICAAACLVLGWWRRQS
jgi:apolipoprotein N-acyltransferase